MRIESRPPVGSSGLRSCVAWLAVLALTVAFGVQLATAAEAPSLDVTAPTTAVSVGDRVSVRVAARGDGDLQWGELRVSLSDGGDWAVADGPREVAGSRPPAWEVVLQPLAVGEIDLPELVTTARAPGGDAVEVRPASPPKITVASVLPTDEEAEPTPLRDPIGVAGLPWEWLLPIALVVLPLALVGWWLWRRRRRAGEVVPARRALPPLPELEALTRELRERIGRDAPDSICDRLAHGLRRYLERRTGEPALEMTTFELRLLGRRRAWSDEIQRGVQRTMNLVDGVRFGRLPAIEDELQRAVDGALAVGRAHERLLEPAATDGLDEATA